MTYNIYINNYKILYVLLLLYLQLYIFSIHRYILYYIYEYRTCINVGRTITGLRYYERVFEYIARRPNNKASRSK